MIASIEENRKLTAADLHRDKEINHNNVSERTIQRCLNSEGYLARIARKKFGISEKNRKKRKT